MVFAFVINLFYESACIIMKSCKRDGRLKFALLRDTLCEFSSDRTPFPVPFAKLARHPPKTSPIGNRRRPCTLLLQRSAHCGLLGSRNRGLWRRIWRRKLRCSMLQSSLVTLLFWLIWCHDVHTHPPFRQMVQAAPRPRKYIWRYFNLPSGHLLPCPDFRLSLSYSQMYEVLPVTPNPIDLELTAIALITVTGSSLPTCEPAA